MGLAWAVNLPQFERYTLDLASPAALRVSAWSSLNTSQVSTGRLRKSEGRHEGREVIKELLDTIQSRGRLRKSEDNVQALTMDNKIIINNVCFMKCLDVVDLCVLKTYKNS